MNIKKIYFLMGLLSPFLLSACDNGGSEQSNYASAPSPIPPAPNPDPNPDPNPEAPCAGQKYANALSALQSRDASKVTETELIAYSQCILNLQINNPLRQQAASIIYQGMGKTFTWNASGYSHYFHSIEPAKTFSLLHVNFDTKASSKENKSDGVYSLAMAGEQQGQRYIALAQNPLIKDVTPRPDSDKSKWMKNMVLWLTEQDSQNRATYRMANQDEKKLHVVLTAVDNSNYRVLKNWLDSHWPDTYTLNDQGDCNDNQLTNCLSTQPVDLLIVGDYDQQGLGYPSISAGIDSATQKKIPLLILNSNASAVAIQSGIYKQLGIAANANLGSRYQSIDFPLADLSAPSAAEKGQATLLKNLERGEFDSNVLNSDEQSTCNRSVLSCKSDAFNQAFRLGADAWRDALIEMDKLNNDVLAHPERHPLLASIVLVADKYRQHIDYPVSADNESTLFQQAMFADWIVDYSRADNQAQPDLGEYVVDKNSATKGTNAVYTPMPPIDDQRTFTIPFTKQVTTSGWLIPAGRAVTLSSTKDSATVILQLGYEFTDSYKSAANKILVAPSESSQKDATRLTLGPGETRTISTPYGGPLYIRFTDDKLTSATITAHGVSHYPTIMDASDAGEIANFEQQLDAGDTPYIDINTGGMEIHLRKHLFTQVFQAKNNIAAGVTTTKAFIEGLSRFYQWNYSLAGLTVREKTLEQSLPANELKICSSLWGADCTDKALHTRLIHQHVNYFPYATCSYGCSGQPIQLTWVPLPYGWGESHELGHNLQVNKLNVQYATIDGKEIWSNYINRGTENSNNIFPYHMLWMSTYGQGKTDLVTDAHYDPLEVYTVIMSEMRGMKDGQGNPVIYNKKCEAYEVTDVTANRYTAPWQTVYAKYNSYRMGFYIQLLFQTEGQAMRDGTTLENGFDIYTLLYQHGRIFEKYVANEALWNSKRDQLGFSEFAFQGDSTYGGKTVKSIPGNDFLLVSLSFITNADWRPYFDMFGLYYTSLASQQVDRNGFIRKIEQKIFTHNTTSTALPNQQRSQDPNFVTVDMTNKDSVFPGHETWTCP